MTENQKKAKRLLEEVSHIPYFIKAKRSEIEAMRIASTGLKAIQYDKDKVQTSPTDLMSETIVKIVSMCERLDHDINILIEKKSICDSILNDKLDQEQRRVITEYYFDDMSFIQIADHMHYSKRTIRNRYSEALEIIGRNL